MNIWEFFPSKIYSDIKAYNSNIKCYVVPKLRDFETVTRVSIDCKYNDKETMTNTLKNQGFKGHFLL